jgi:hypothetical protein
MILSLHPKILNMLSTILRSFLMTHLSLQKQTEITKYFFHLDFTIKQSKYHWKLEKISLESKYFHKGFFCYYN